MNELKCTWIVENFVKEPSFKELAVAIKKLGHPFIPSVPIEATKFCNKLLNSMDYIPDSVFCLDLCQDNDDECWLMELTSFSSAGLYVTDKEAIVNKVSQIALEEWEAKYKRV